MHTVLSVILILCSILAGIVAFYFFKQLKTQNKINKDLQLQHQQLLEQYQLVVVANTQLLESEQYLKEVDLTKDKFFSIIAHDLKSPLNTIVGFLQLLNDHVDAFTKDELRNFANSMNKSVKNLLGLLDNLLHWSRSQTGTIEYHPTIINLQELVGENINLLVGHAQSKGISMENNIDEQLFLKADINMLHVIVRNLLSNAVKFTRKGGLIQVEANKNDAMINILVKDNGIGMSPDKVEKLFKMGYNQTTSGTAQEKGNGLGLLLCREFVEKNKGTIRVESQVGKGSTFIISLPAN